jgi:hypothetical protein
VIKTMGTSFEKMTEVEPAPDAFSPADVLDRAALDALGDLRLTDRDVQLDLEANERSQRGLTATYEYASEDIARFKHQLFATRYEFLYENRRIKSTEVLCRQLREVFTRDGMPATEVHRLFSGELAAIIKQLAAYEMVPVPKPEQAQDEMALRSRLLTTATARFFEATKKSMAEVSVAPPDVAAETERASFMVPLVPQAGSTKHYEAMEDEARLPSVPPEDHELFLRANRIHRDELVVDVRDATDTIGLKTPVSVDNDSSRVAAARTIETVPMAAETPKNAATNAEALQQQREDLEVFVAENDARRREAAAAVASVVAERPQNQSTDKKTGWWDKDFVNAKLGTQSAAVMPEQLLGSEVVEAERSVASLMAQADRLIALTKRRREKVGVSHKEAKNESDDYAAARSEITKIKNRLRAILSDKDVVHKRAEVDELRTSLAGHLWNLRRDFPVGKEKPGEDVEVAVAVTEVDPLVKQKTAAVEHLRTNFAEAHAAQHEALRAGVPILITLPDGRKVEGETEYIHDNETTLSVSWLEGTTRMQQVVDRSAVMELTDAEAMPVDGIPVEQFAPHDTLHEAHQAASVESAITNAREKLERIIAETASYQNSILSGTEDDTLMTLKRELQSLETRITSAKLSPASMRPEELKAMRSQLATIEYQLVQLEVVAPKKLLGLVVPRAGDGPFAVRAFRDALTIEWQPFKRASANSADAAVVEKRQAFEQMFKVLAYVPESGITDAEARLLRSAAEKIALPHRITSAFSLEVGAATSTETVPPHAMIEVLQQKGAAAARLLEAKLPAVAQRELATAQEAKARRWFERGGILTVGVLTGLLLAGDQREEKTVVASGGDSYSTSAPAQPVESPSPTIRAIDGVAPIVGTWATAVDDGVPITVARETPGAESGRVEPTITDVTDSVTATTELVPDYIVQASDNLWDFVEGDVEDREPLAPLKGLTELQKNMVLSDMVTALKYNKDRMRELGLRSGNPNKIFVGEVIKTHVLIDLLEEIKRDRGLS